jgi:hypothetical protein
MPRSSEITKAGPCARCDDTDKTIPSSGNTASRPLHAGPAQPDNEVTSSVRTAPATILPVRSERVSGAPAAPAELRGKNDWPKHTAARAAVAAQTGEVGNIDKPYAEINHVMSPAVNATGHERERQVHAYAKLNASDARIAESDSVAARAPKLGPCASTRMNRIGPAITGRPANQPVIDGPHHLPDIETTRTNSGTSVSLSASMPKSGGSKVRSYPRPLSRGVTVRANGCYADAATMNHSWPHRVPRPFATIAAGARLMQRGMTRPEAEVRGTPKRTFNPLSIPENPGTALTCARGY